VHEHAADGSGVLMHTGFEVAIKAHQD
jgi:hypothetical protein